MTNDDYVIKVENVSKKFSKSLRRSLALGSFDLLRNFLNIPTQQSRLRKSEFWALKDINFELKKGEILGVIGENGSGKSTLLRLLTGIFPPDTGKIEMRGEVGALIAVGAGFHPHMTGRENIYLNGTILGMKSDEIKQKFADIVDFADIGEFLDAPVATYSSGMKVRLGFSIAIHKIPEVLLVDEVLAVGDISFKKKCMEKIEQIKKDTSIIYISHDMNQVERICDKVIVMDKGQMYFYGDTHEAIDKYYNLTISRELEKSSDFMIIDSTGEIKNLEIVLKNKNGIPQNKFTFGEEIMFDFTFNSEKEFINPVLGFNIVSPEGLVIGNLKNTVFKNRDDKIKVGKNNFSILLKNNILLPNTYKLSFKWKTVKDSTLIEASGKKFSILSKPELIQYGGYVKFEFDWKSLN